MEQGVTEAWGGLAGPLVGHLNKTRGTVKLLERIFPTTPAVPLGPAVEVKGGA